MYKVVLVDDEQWALADIFYTFQFEAFGFEVVGQFTNPRIALKEIPVLQPDIIFADIRMPSISGLELVGKLKEYLPELTVIIFSGYSEFTYAQEAIKLTVFEYCLKPVNDEEALALMGRLSDHMKKIKPLIVEKEEEPTFSHILNYVDRHIYDQIVIKDLANTFFLNANYCGQLFRKHTGKTFSQYMRDKRLKKACELLTRSRIPINTVASKVGFKNPYYFSRVFSEHIGVSPREYRLNHSP